MCGLLGILQVIADCCLDARELEIIRTRFDRLDADKDGFLTYEELLGSLKRLKVPITEDEVKAMFDAVSSAVLYWEWGLTLSCRIVGGRGGGGGL